MAIKDDIGAAALTVQNELIQEELHALHVPMGHVDFRAAQLLYQSFREIGRNPSPVTVSRHLKKTKTGVF